MSAKHTPGPWEVGQPRTIFRVGERALAVAVTERSRPEAAANARLIAAAPELLEALKRLLAIYEAQGPGAAGDFARAAIAKATGEQS